MINLKQIEDIYHVKDGMPTQKYQKYRRSELNAKISDVVMTYIFNLRNKGLKFVQISDMTNVSLSACQRIYNRKLKERGLA